MKISTSVIGVLMILTSLLLPRGEDALASGLLGAFILVPIGVTLIVSSLSAHPIKNNKSK